METYRNRKVKIEKRVDDLLSRMNIDEKIAQLGSVWGKNYVVDGKFSLEALKPRIRHGLGHFSRPCMMLPPHEVRDTVNKVQKFLVEETHLGIPAIFHEESCAGLMAKEATCFPMPIGMAATWDPEVVREVADVIRRQTLAVGVRHALAPVADVVRDARWGRIEETFGEDPYLVSRMAVAYVQGMQTDSLENGVICTGKHFAGHSFPEGGLNWAPVHIPHRELMDVFIRPFAALIGEAKVESIMNAYHENDGIPAGACRELLTEMLREKLGFTGHVASDYFTLPSLHNYHNIAVDEEEAALLGLEAGIDVELPELQVYHTPIKEALAKGKLSIDLVDNSVRRVLRSKFRLGLFERPYAEGGDIVEVFGAPSNRDLARKVAEKSIVLLKNKNGVLPIKPDVGTIAAIGPGAGSRRLMQGDYHYPAHHELLFGPIPTHEGLPPQTLSREMQGRLNGLIGPQPGGSSARSEGIDYSEHMPKMVTVLEGIRRNAKGLNVIYERGCGVYDEDADGISKAVEAARRADVAIVVVGEKSGLHPGCTAGEFRDRATLHLPGSQRRLVEEVASTGVKTVVVLLNGRPLATPWLEERADAILEAWLPGQEGGSAIADILFGKTSPGGRLPVSMPRDAGQMPSYYNHKSSGRFSKPFKDYADMPVSPLYGFGLSYTSFEYSDGRVEPEEVATDKSVDVTITVANAGKMAGDEVVQLYVRDVAGSTTRPVRELKGFTRVHLAPGERKRVTFRLDMSQLAFHGRSGRLCTEPGEVEIMVGSSSETFYFRKTISVVGKEKEYRFTTIKPTTVLVS